MAKQKLLTGVVVSDKMDKTIIVKVMHKIRHPKYNRIVKRYNKFKVHDEKEQAHVGDTVTIAKTRPLSKEKYFRLVGIVKKAQLLSHEIKEQIP
ncbi:MAG: 30S ribosomal protein S17 [Candidatus Omnitrophica bacterium]|nr:30S ribosomal protein S17 [Candidatus Omnitrophota bacterium]